MASLYKRHFQGLTVELETSGMTATLTWNQ